MCTPSLIIFQEHYTNEALEMKVTVTIPKMVIEVQSNPKQIKHAPYKVCMCQPSANIWFLQIYKSM